MNTSSSSRPPRTEMWAARMRRDPSYDGIFWIGVTSTKIYCRPSCPARLPLEAHVRYVYSLEAALSLGLRPCRRCNPDRAHSRHPPLVEELLELSRTHAGVRLTDQDLIANGISPLQARRLFRRTFGTTFHAHHRARRMESARRELAQGSSSLEVALGQGYRSLSGLQEAFQKRFDQSPRPSKRVSSLPTRTLSSPLGEIFLAATSEGLAALEFHDRKGLPGIRRRLEGKFQAPLIPGESSFFEVAESQLEEYFQGTRRRFEIPLDLTGTPFQREVWRELSQIPYGQTVSYGELAERVGKPGGARAVGRANGANCLALILPCHRVVQADGGLRGYAGGLWRKRKLLELERETLERAKKPAS